MTINSFVLSSHENLQIINSAEFTFSVSLIYNFILSLNKIVYKSSTSLQRSNISPIKSDLKWHDLLSHTLLVSAADLLEI